MKKMEQSIKDNFSILLPREACIATGLWHIYPVKVSTKDGSEIVIETGNSEKSYKSFSADTIFINLYEWNILRIPKAWAWFYNIEPGDKYHFSVDYVNYKIIGRCNKQNRFRKPVLCSFLGKTHLYIPSFVRKIVGLTPGCCFKTEQKEDKYYITVDNCFGEKDKKNLIRSNGSICAPASWRAFDNPHFLKQKILVDIEKNSIVLKNYKRGDEFVFSKNQVQKYPNCCGWD